MADLNVAVRIAGIDAASGPIGAASAALARLADAASAPVKALGGITTAIGAAGLAAQGLSTIGSAVASVFGLGMASSMEQVRAQLTAMTGSGEAAAAVLEDIRREAAATPFEFGQMAKATASLLPAAKQSGVALMDLVRQAEVLAASNPAEGLEGAAFALREALSGDFVSVVDRFNLPRQRLNELRAQGVPALQAISTAMKEMGLDARLVTGMSETFAGRWSTFTDTIAGFQARLGAGLFDGLKAGLLGAQALFESNGDAIGAALESIGQGVGRFVSDAVPRLLAFGQQAIPAVLAGVERLRAVLGPLSERVSTFVASLASGATLATTVNRAFGDLIPPQLNAALDAADLAFGRVRDAVVGIAAAVQSGGLGAVWAQVAAAMADFAPTGERVQAALGAIGAAIRAVVPQPIQDFVANVVAMATGAAAGSTPLQLLAAAVNAVSGVLAAATQFVKDHVAVQALLVGALTAGSVAWGVSSAIAAYTTIQTTATVATVAARAAWTLLNATIAANPIGAVVVVLSALAAALVYAYNNSETFRDAVDAAFAAVKAAVETTMTVSVPLIKSFAATVVATATTVGRFVADVVGFFANLQSNVSARTTALLQSVPAAWNAIRSSVVEAASALATAVTGAFESLRSTVADTQDRLTRYLLEQWTQAIPQDIRDGLAEIGDLLAQRWSQFVGDVSDAMDDIATAVRAGWGVAQEVTGRVLAAVRGVVQTAWVTIRGAVDAAMLAIAGLVEEHWGAVEATTGSVLGAVAGVVDDVWQTIKTSVLTPLGDVLAAVQETWAQVHQAVSTALGIALAAVVEFGKGLLKTLGDLVGSTLAQARALGQSIIDGLTGAIRAGAGQVAELITWLAREAIQAAIRALKPGSPSKVFTEIGETIPQGLAAGIQRGTAAAVGAMQRVVRTLIDAATGERLSGGRAIGAAIAVDVAEGVANNTNAVLAAIAALSQRGAQALKDLAESIGGKFTGWIGDVLAKRSKLLWQFNFEAYKRGDAVKVLPGLEDATRDFIARTEALVAESTGKLHGLAVQYEADVLALRRDAAKQVLDVAADARARIDELTEQRSLQRRIEARKAAFDEMLRVQKEGFDRQQAQLEGALRLQEQTARIAFQAQLKLNRVGVDAAPGVTAAQQALDAQTELLRIGYQESRDLGRAATEAEKAEIAARATEARRALEDRLAEERYLLEATRELRLTLQREQIQAEAEAARQALQDQQAEELYVAEHTAALRTEILTRQFAMDQQLAKLRREFEQDLENDAFRHQVARIEEERDERIRGINEALAAKEAALTDAYQKERAALLANLADQLKVYQEQYIDKIKAAFQAAGVDLVDFMDMINNDLKRRTAETSAQILAMVEELTRAQHAIGGTPAYTYVPPPRPALPDTTRVGSPTARSTPAAARQYTVNVYPQQATIDEAEVGRVLQRMVLLNG